MRQKDQPNASLDDLMQAHGFETVEHKPARRTAGKILLAPMVMILCFMLMFALVGTTTMGLVGAAGVQAAAPVVEVWKTAPSTLPDISIAERNIIYDKNGGVIAEVWSENRLPVKDLKSISPYAIKGLIATEDKNFYRNKGYDVSGMARAAVKGQGGGSGITQQLIKNLLFYNMLSRDKKQDAVERSYYRKIRELKMALEYERTHSKDEILLNYFNTVAFGAPTTYGIETASQYFFAKPAKNLTLAEAAALVGTGQNPVIFNMSSKATEKKWKARQKEVLQRMVAEKIITPEEAKKAAAEPLKFSQKKHTAGTCYESRYPFYCKYVMDYMRNSPRLGETPEDREAILARGGLRIKTYMDPAAMDTIDRYMKKNWGTDNRIIAPTALVQPGTGGVVAMGANRDLGSGPGKTDIVLPNTPAGEGSVYKIFTLAAALTQGGMTERDLTFSSYGCPLRPGREYDAPPGGFRNSSSCKLQGGLLNYKQATAYSSNTWFVTLEMKIGVEKLKQFSRSVGLSAPDYIGPRSLSYTLGSVENKPIDLAAAFATFSNKGVYCPPTPVESMKYSDGAVVPMPDNYNPAGDACRAVMSPQAAGVVLKAMRANLSGEVPKAFGIRSNVPGIDNGGKSGTNEDLNSTWTHLTGQYSLFTTVYDMERTSRGVDGAIFKGEPTSWHKNTAQTTGGELMRKLTAGKPKVPLLWDTPDNTFAPVKVNESNFFLVPSVIGMTPSEALTTFEALGMKAHISKELKRAPEGYPSGVIVAQSLDPGEKLSKGTKKEMVLYLSQ